MIPQYIPDVFAAITGRVSATMENLPINPYKVFFDFGHYREVTKNLAWKDASISSKDKKYPLVWLVMDFDEYMGENPADYARTPGLQFIIAVPTRDTYTMEERKEKSFLPLLYPIYVEFLRQISFSPELGMPAEISLKHIKTDRPYWGGSQDPNGNNEKNLFNDYIDAIQIRNLNVSIKRKVC